MINLKEETISIAWCDSGHTDAKFTEKLVSTVASISKTSNSLINTIRVQGNQIARQRDAVFHSWETQENLKSDWLLWVDSDIVLNEESLNILFSHADKKTAPVISGVYFIMKENLDTLPTPIPCIFLKTENKNEVEHIHPLPENQFLKIDHAGMGIVLMHRSIIKKIRLKYKQGIPLFAEINESIGNFISEDIMFFNKLRECGVAVYTHTSALFQHMKTFPFDINYYLMYWDSEHKIKRPEDNSFKY